MCRFVPLRPEHIFALDLQESQRFQYGIDLFAIGVDEAEHYASQPAAWTMLDGVRPIACFGILETFPGAAGVAWALIGKNIGRGHHRLTRFARDEVIGKSTLPRVEAIVRCDLDLPPPDGAICDAPTYAWLMLKFALDHPTPEVRWAIDVGLHPVAVLRKFGAANETHMLMERIL